MVARIWHGFALPQHADSYEKMLKPELLPGISKVPGFRGSFLMRREHGEEVEFITMILFDSIDNIRAVAGPDYETAIVPDIRRQYLSHWDEKAAHFEIASIQGISSLTL